MTTRRPRERRDRAGLARCDLVDDAIERHVLVGEQERTARDRGDQRHGVAVREHGLLRGVLLVDGVEQSVGLVAELERLPHVCDRVGVDLLLRPTGSFAEAGEESHRHAHASSVPGVTAVDRRETESGIEVEPVYTPDDAPDATEPPGVPPFTRGPYPDMYRGRPWTIRQYAGFASAEETNARFRYLLEHGQMGLSVAFDLPTQLGLDSDDPRSLGEVGRTGVAIDSLGDMELLFHGIPLGDVSTSMTINAPA